MSTQLRPKKLIGSSRYGIALEPKTTTFSPELNGKVYFFDGKHVIETHPFSSLDQLAKLCYNFWEGTITGQLNFRRFSFWFSDFLSDFGIQKVNEEQLQEELRPLNTGVVLQRTGHKIKEAKVVYHEPVKTLSEEKPVNYRNMLSSPGVPIKEAKVVYHEPVTETKREQVVSVEEHRPYLGETAAEVRARLRPTGMPIREAKVVPEPIREEEPIQKKLEPVAETKREQVVSAKEHRPYLGETAAEVRARLRPTGMPIREAKVVPEPIGEEEPIQKKLEPVGSFKDIRQIETSSEPIEQKKEQQSQPNVLPFPKRKLEPPEDKLAKPSEILEKGSTKSPTVSVLPPLRRPEPRSILPDKKLLKPSEVLKEKETIFDEDREMFEIEVRESEKPTERLLKPSEYLRKRETIPVISKEIGKSEKVSSTEHRLVKPSELGKKDSEKLKTTPTISKTVQQKDGDTLTLRKPSQKELESISSPKKIVAETIPSPAKIGELEQTSKRYSISDVSGIGESKAELLKEAGIDTVEKLANSSVDVLVKIKGIGPATAEKYIANAKKLLSK